MPIDERTFKSDTNPVRNRRNHNIKLDLDHFGLSRNDLETSFHVGKEIGIGSAKLKDIVTRLKKIYLGSIGYEYSHLREPLILAWFRSKCETEGAEINPSQREKRQILGKLNEAVVFENFYTKYIGQKGFLWKGREHYPSTRQNNKKGG